MSFKNVNNNNPLISVNPSFDKLKPSFSIYQIVFLKFIIRLNDLKVARCGFYTSKTIESVINACSLYRIRFPSNPWRWPAPHICPQNTQNISASFKTLIFRELKANAKVDNILFVYVLTLTHTETNPTQDQDSIHKCTERKPRCSFNVYIYIFAQSAAHAKALSAIAQPTKENFLHGDKA